MLYFNKHFTQNRSKTPQQSLTATKNSPPHLTPILQVKIALNSNGGPSLILSDHTHEARIRRIAPIQEGVNAACKRLFSTEEQNKKQLRRHTSAIEEQKEKQEKKEKREKERQEKREKREQERQEKKKRKEEEKEREREEKRKKKEKERKEKRKQKERDKQAAKEAKIKEKQKAKRIALIRDRWPIGERRTRLEAFVDFNDYKRTYPNLGKPFQKMHFLQKLLNQPFLYPVQRWRRTRCWAYERKDGKPVKRKPRPRRRSQQEKMEARRRRAAFVRLAASGVSLTFPIRRWTRTGSTVIKTVKRHVKLLERRSAFFWSFNYWNYASTLFGDHSFINASDTYHIRLFQLTKGGPKETAEITEAPVLRNDVAYFGYYQDADDYKPLDFASRAHDFCKRMLVITNRRDYPYVYLPIRLDKFEQFEQILFFHVDGTRQKNFRVINASAARLIEQMRYKIYLAPVPYVSALDREAGIASLECAPAFHTLSSEGLLLIEDPAFVPRFHPPNNKRVLVFGDEGQEVPQWLVSKDWYAYYALGLVRAVFPEDLFVSYEDKIYFEGVIAKSELDLIIMYENVWYWDTLEKVGGPIGHEEEYLVLRDAMYINTASDEKLLDSYHSPLAYTITPPFTVEVNELEREVENFAAEGNFNYGHDEFTFGHLEDVLYELDNYEDERLSIKVTEDDTYESCQNLGWTTIEKGHSSTPIFSKEAFRKYKIRQWKEENRTRRIKDAQKPPTNKEPRYYLRRAYVPFKGS